VGLGALMAVPIGIAAALVAFYVVLGLNRGQIGYQQSGAGRYVYEGAVFWLLLLADAARGLPWRGTWRPALIACLFLPWGLVPPGAGPEALAIGAIAYLAKLAIGGFLLALFETSIAKMRVFRVPEFLGAALMLGLLATLLLFVSRSL